jgi:hypothetical protein
MPKSPQNEHVEDLIDESLIESFPASDPPAMHSPEHGRKKPADRNPRSGEDEDVKPA